MDFVVTCTEFVNQKRRSLTLQQLTQQPESGTLSRKRAPHRSKDPVETPRNDPIELKRSRPADPEQDPDPAESSVARPTGSAGATLLLVAAAVQDVDESADAVVAPDDGAAPGQQHTGNHRKRRRRKPSTNSKARRDAKWRKNK